MNHLKTGAPLFLLLAASAAAQNTGTEHRWAADLRLLHDSVMQAEQHIFRIYPREHWLADFEALDSRADSLDKNESREQLDTP